MKVVKSAATMVKAVTATRPEAVLLAAFPDAEGDADPLVVPLLVVFCCLGREVSW
jgi:hypothetical protein